MSTNRCCLCMPASNSVDLLLLRHGIAEERPDGLDHPDRALTARGQRRTLAVASALVRRGVQADRLITSPYQRALDTARIAVGAGLAPMLEIDQALVPGGDVLALARRLTGRVCLVGHEPDLSWLAADLLGLPTRAIVLKKAGLVHLQGSDGHWQLQALLRPALLIDPIEA